MSSMSWRAFAVVASAILLLTACPAPAPVVPQPIGEGDYPEPPDNIIEVEADDSVGALASPCGIACLNLRALSCPEGNPKRGVTCYRACIAQAQHQRVPTKCWANAKTVAVVRACGGIRCLN